MEPPPLPVVPLSYIPPTVDVWRPFARLSAWIGIALGLFNVMELLVLLSMFLNGRHFSWSLFRPIRGPQLVLVATANAALSVLMIWGAVLCLRSLPNGRRLFLYAIGGLAAMSLVSIILLLTLYSPRWGARVFLSPFALMTAIVNLREMLLPLLLWILMFKSQSRAGLP